MSGVFRADRSKASRERLYKAIEVAMEKFPDLRIGQLIANIDMAAADLYHVENDQLAVAIYEYVNEH